MKNRKVLLVVKSLACGGAERVVVNLAEGFVTSKMDVVVVTTDGEVPDYFELSGNIQRFSLVNWKKVNNPIKRNWSLLRELRKIFKEEEPDFIISFVHMVNLRAILAHIGLNSKLIITEHTSPLKAPLAIQWRTTRRILYPLCDRLVCVSEGVSAGFDWLRKRSVIYNPIPKFSESQREKTNQIIGAVGRLHRAKGFDILIETFATVVEKRPNWQLHIYGDGEERAKLESLVRQHNLDESVMIKGFASDIAKAYRSMDLFVLSSRYEGLGLVLAEAQSLGVPCISFDCPSGPSEIIEDGIDGLLIENGNKNRLAFSIIQLIDSPKKRKQLSLNGQDSAKRFQINSVIEEWLNLFNSLE